MGQEEEEEEQVQHFSKPKFSGPTKFPFALKAKPAPPKVIEADSTKKKFPVFTPKNQPPAVKVSSLTKDSKEPPATVANPKTAKDIMDMHVSIVGTLSKDYNKSVEKILSDSMEKFTQFLASQERIHQMATQKVPEVKKESHVDIHKIEEEALEKAKQLLLQKLSNIVLYEINEDGTHQFIEKSVEEYIQE
jgi:hypothetical protein